MGIASALALSTPSSIAIVQVAGPRARQAIAMLTIIGGLASTVFWPVTGALERGLGWRSTLLLYAAIHLLACAPIHWLILPRRPPIHPAPADRRRATPAAWRRKTCSRVLPAAVDQPRLRRLRLHRRAAADDRDAARPRPFAAVGPAARLDDRASPGRHPHLRAAVRPSLFDHELGRVRLADAAVGLGLALLAGDVFVVALLVVVAYGMSNGLKAVQRATLPLALFGRAQFGAYMGRLALPQGIVAAVSPPIMARVLSRFGTAGALWLSFAFATVSLLAMVLLARRSRAVR
jgi:hypothetical protein